MKHRLLYVAAGVALMVAFGCVIFIMQVIYDLNPQNWGPQGVEFEAWGRVWKAYRDRYVLIGLGSLFIFVILILAGLWFDPNRERRRTTH